MKTFLLVVVSLFTLSFGCFAQKTSKHLASANKLFKNFDYEKAIEGYKNVLKRDKENLAVRIKIAEAYAKLHNAEASIFWYNEALGPVRNRARVKTTTFFDYAEVLAEKEKYNEALKWYQLYKAVEPKDKRVLEKIDVINNRAALFADSARFEVTPLEINSPYSEFSPTFYDDGIVFASAREEVGKRKRYNYNNSAFLDLYYSPFQDSVLRYADKFNQYVTSPFHDGSAVFYDHDTKMIFTRNAEYTTDVEREDVGDYELTLQLYYSEKDEYNEWIDPIPLFIDKRSHSMGHPAITQDGKTLIFTSNMPSGFGGTDLYISHWVDGDWSRPENLGEWINTKSDEMFPFIYQDSILFFSSNGYGGLGGLDIFRVSLKTQQVKNVGYPLNTQGDDFSIIVNKDGKTGYFASNRLREDDDDLFQFVIKDPADLKGIKNKQVETISVATAAVVEQPHLSSQVAEGEKINEQNSEPAIISSYEEKTQYTVQILALSKPKPINKIALKKLKGAINHEFTGGLHRYTYGRYNTEQEAELILSLVQASGYKDAFIRKVYQDEEISDDHHLDVNEMSNKPAN